MNEIILHELIFNGESSTLGFQRDCVRPEELAKEMCALLNRSGGRILLGVEDGGTISGLTRSKQDAETWVMNIALNNLRPSVIPDWSSVVLDDGKIVAVIGLEMYSFEKPYEAKSGSSWEVHIRSGTKSRVASREQIGRLYQDAQIVRYDVKPVHGTSIDSLDMHRIENYFKVILNRDAPAPDDYKNWIRILLNLDILTEFEDELLVTAAGILLFGKNPNRRFPQAGITAAAFPGSEKDYDFIDNEIIRGPLVSSLSKVSSRMEDRQIIEKGVIDRAVDFVSRNVGSEAWLNSAMRVTRKKLPEAAVREAIVNAVAHRDYTLTGTDIEISLYSDRLEVISPGRLPNGATVEKIKEGIRVTRNEMLKNILRDYHYIEHQGMGIRNKIIASMREHNGTEPGLIEEEDRFIVLLRKSQSEVQAL